MFYKKLYKFLKLIKMKFILFHILNLNFIFILSFSYHFNYKNKLFNIIIIIINKFIKISKFFINKKIYIILN